MKRVSIIAVLFLAGLYSVKGHAQVVNQGKTWTITDCIKYASEHNIQVNTLRLTEQLDQQNLIAARGARIPSLYADATNYFVNANNNAAGNGNLVNQLTSNGNYSINSSIVLWNGNAVNNKIQQEQLQTQSDRLSVQQSLNNITLLLTQDFLNVLLAKENLKYVTEVVGASEERVKQGQMLYDEGSIAKKDLLQLQAQLASDKYLMVQVQNSIRQNTLILMQTLQLPADTLFAVAKPDTVIVPTFLPPLSDVRETALQNFPDVKIGKLGLDIASLDIAKARAGFKPVLTAAGTLATGYHNVITNAKSPETEYFTQTGNNFYQQAGLTLHIPIFSNYINKTNLQKAKISYQQAGLNFQNESLVLSQAVEQAYLNANNAIQSYQAADIQLRSASESYRISNEQFKLGAINSYDLLQQRNQYVQAVQAFTLAKYTAVLQQKIYEYYMGNPVTL